MHRVVAGVERATQCLAGLRDSRRSGGRRMTKKQWFAWATLSALGVAIMALPDDNRRLFSLSRTHGPDPVDAVGAILLIVGWCLLLVAVWRHRHALPTRWTWRLVAATVVVVAASVLVWSVSGDHGMWWLAGAAMLAGVQIAGAVLVTVRRER